jgi:hypothetical protein
MQGGGGGLQIYKIFAILKRIKHSLEDSDEKISPAFG